MDHAFGLTRRQMLATSTATLAAGPWAWGQKKSDPDPKRFAKDIASFGKWDQKNAWPKDNILFVGSSSVRMWPTQINFADLPVINRGFGGSHISDVIHYADKIVLPYQPRVILLYAGDNDIGGGKSPKRVMGDYEKFVKLVHGKLPKTHIVFLPIKPSRSRWKLWPKMKQVNDAISAASKNKPLEHYTDTAAPMLATGNPPAEDLFLKDGLHLSTKGYAMWNKVVRATLNEILKK